MSNLMKFKHSELINPEVKVKSQVIPFGSKRFPVGTYPNVIKTDVEMTADEAKEYCVKMYKENRYVELIHDNLVWCDSWSYALDYEEE